MSQFSQPQHKNAAAGENRGVGPFNDFNDFNVVLLDLESSDIAAVSFKGSLEPEVFC